MKENVIKFIMVILFIGSTISIHFLSANVKDLQNRVFNLEVKENMQEGWKNDA